MERIAARISSEVEAVQKLFLIRRFGFTTGILKLAGMVSGDPFSSTEVYSGEF